MISYPFVLFAASFVWAFTVLGIALIQTARHARRGEFDQLPRDIAFLFEVHEAKQKEGLNEISTLEYWSWGALGIAASFTIVFVLTIIFDRASLLYSDNVTIWLTLIMFFTVLCAALTLSHRSKAF